MQRFLNIDKRTLQKVEKLIAYSPEYDLRGWIREAIEELIESEEEIKESDLSQFKSSYSRLGFSFEVEFWEKFDEAVRRLKALKKCVSRNVLVNQAISRKIVGAQRNINISQESKRLFYQEELPIKGRKIKLDLRLPLKILEDVKRCVEQRKIKNVGYSISDWLNEAVRHFLLEESKKTPLPCGLNDNDFLENKKRTAVYLEGELLKEIDCAVSLRKKKRKGFSRTTWLQEATTFYLSHSII